MIDNAKELHKIGEGIREPICFAAADELESLRRNDVLNQQVIADLRAKLKEAELAEGRAKTRAMRLEIALADTEALELGTSERLEKTMAQLKEAQAEIERLKGNNNAGLDTNPNNAESKQQWELVSSVEMGQLLERGKDKGAGNSKTQGVIVLTGVDEYGPMLNWHTHWADFKDGSNFYSEQQLAASQARISELEMKLAASQSKLKSAMISEQAKTANTITAAFRMYDAERMANARLAEQLAASQANEVQLREALSQGCGWAPIGSTSKSIMYMALAIPCDTTALDAMIQKAGDVMRRRCADACLRIITMRWENDCAKEADDCYEAIRALPGVTLQDLQNKSEDLK